MTESLEDLLLIKLKALYDIESELMKALPKMAKSASAEEVHMLFTEHLKETEEQKERLEKIFEILGEKPQKLKSEAIRGMVEDTIWLLNEDMSPEALDASLVAAAQYIEHYEIAGYGTAKAWAEELGMNEVADILEEILKEETLADKKLTQLAESFVNSDALVPTANE